jgi:hypothetical protein
MASGRGLEDSPKSVRWLSDKRRVDPDLWWLQQGVGHFGLDLEVHYWKGPNGVVQNKAADSAEAVYDSQGGEEQGSDSGRTDDEFKVIPEGV